MIYSSAHIFGYVLSRIEQPEGSIRIRAFLLKWAPAAACAAVRLGIPVRQERVNAFS